MRDRKQLDYARYTFESDPQFVVFGSGCWRHRATLGGGLRSQDGFFGQRGGWPEEHSNEWTSVSGKNRCLTTAQHKGTAAEAYPLQF